MQPRHTTIAVDLTAVEGDLAHALDRRALGGARGMSTRLRERGATLDDLAYSSKAIPEPIPVKRWTVYG